MNKKGFTLMELLAVLVVLALIALIVFPIVGDVINDSRRKSFERSVEGLERAAEIDYQDDGYKGDRTYQYENENFTLVDVRGTVKSENIKVEGLIQEGVGQVYVDADGNTSLTVYNDEWCATKASTDKTITIEAKTDSNCVISSVQTFTEIMTGNSEVMNNDPDGNLRYVGADPDNYVWFSKDSDGNPERWRVIGVFNGQAKIIKNDYYLLNDNNFFEWDSNKTNNWDQSTLQLALNNTTDGYITTIQTIDPTSYSYIDLEHVWNLGGYDDNYITATRSDFYNAERSEITAGASGSEATWTGAIGLMYPSDYGYASNGDVTTCDSRAMYEWDWSTTQTECVKKSWLYYDGNRVFWTLTPRSDSSGYVFTVDYFGRVDRTLVYAALVVYPALYLKSNVTVIDGQGTYDEPFQLGA